MIETVMETCFSCGIRHKNVEAHGIFHCPNALCMGCGGAWFRSTLDSYEDCGDNTHTVDDDEWLEKGLVYNNEHKINRKRFFRTKHKNANDNK